ncbi:MAG: DUF4381 domain-containing protein [Candidatus Binatia bacterium]|nr:DUF4381 domain-containing protein [Candidatus Binatia bacterium]
MNAPTDLMNAAAGGAQGDPLAALRGIHFPAAVGMWPPAPGWWIALAVVVALLVLTVVGIRIRRASLAHHALCELETIDGASADFQGLATSVSALLRRVALTRFGRTQVASLHGSAWQEFLSETSPREKRRRVSFDEDMGQLLAMAPYAPPGSASFELEGTSVGRKGVVAAARDWIRWNT